MFDLNFNVASTPEPLRIIKDKFIVDIVYYNKELTFHFFGNPKVWKNWNKEKIDELFKDTFGAVVKDMTGMYEELVKSKIKSADNTPQVVHLKNKYGVSDIKEISFLNAYNKIKNDPARIQKNFFERLPMYEQGKDWDSSQHMQTWSYSIKDPNVPFMDVQAKKIVEGIENIL